MLFGSLIMNLSYSIRPIGVRRTLSEFYEMNLIELTASTTQIRLIYSFWNPVESDRTSIELERGYWEY